MKFVWVIIASRKSVDMIDKIKDIGSPLIMETYDKTYLVAHGVWSKDLSKYTGEIAVGDDFYKDTDLEKRVGSGIKILACYYSDPQKIHKLEWGGVIPAKLTVSDCFIMLDPSKINYKISTLKGN